MQAIEPLPDWSATHRIVEQLELEQACGLTAGDIDELVEYGTLLPLLAADEGARKFSAEWIEPLREAARLRRFYDLDLFAVGLVLGYLARIERLEERIRVLHGQLPHPVQVPRDGPACWREPHG
jgi:chaperone modulatory protein CbpM